MALYCVTVTSVTVSNFSCIADRPDISVPGEARGPVAGAARRGPPRRRRLRLHRHQRRRKAGQGGDHRRGQM